MTNTTAAEIESIVRRVLATLDCDATSLPTKTLSLLDNVISIQSLKDRMLGIQVLEIGKTTVITPAARDLCKELRVDIVRGQGTSRSTDPLADNNWSTATHPARLLVAGTPSWMVAIARQLCTKQVSVCDMAIDDSSVLRSIADGLRAGHQAGLAIVNSPHALCWQAARDDRMRPAVVTAWHELSGILLEVPANVLILSTKTWNVASTCNSARRFYQHLQKQS